MDERTAARFWAKVDKSGTCWIWTGYTDPRGYGQMRRNGESRLVHRFAVVLAGVDLRPSDSVDHRCHNKSCVNPEHLRVVTNKQNHENLSGPYRNSKSGVRGVSWDARQSCWRASVGHNGTLHRRRFGMLEEAAEWVSRKRSELFTHSDMDRPTAIPSPDHTRDAV